MRKEFLNRDNVYETFLNLFKEQTENFGYDFYTYQSEIEDYTFWQTESTINDMKKYCHKKDTKMIGNLCNIREDWEVTKEFVESNIIPWGNFDDIVISIDNDTISDEDLAKFQEWAFDWFFTAFGTFGLKYNFGDWLVDCCIDEEDLN